MEHRESTGEIIGAAIEFIESSVPILSNPSTKMPLSSNFASEISLWSTIEFCGADLRNQVRHPSLTSIVLFPIS